MKGSSDESSFPPLLFIALAFGLSACISQTDRRADLRVALHDQVASCYPMPLEARDGEPVVVEAHLKPDGSLERPPVLLKGLTGSPNAEAALRALTKCAPFKIPPEWTSRHRDWKILRIQFDTK